MVLAVQRSPEVQGSCVIYCRAFAVSLHLPTADTGLHSFDDWLVCDGRGVESWAVAFLRKKILVFGDDILRHALEIIELPKG